MKRITGIFGFWKFPVLNKFMGPRVSIRDHEVTSGKPGYVNNFTIHTTRDDNPWSAVAAYDFKLRQALVEADGTILIEHLINIKKGNVFGTTQSSIDRLGTRRAVHEQVEPR